MGHGRHGTREIVLGWTGAFGVFRRIFSVFCLSMLWVNTPAWAWDMGTMARPRRPDKYYQRIWEVLIDMIIHIFCLIINVFDCLSDVHTKDYYQWFDNQGVWWHHLIITDTYTFDNVNSQKNSFSLTIFTEALLSASPILSPASLTPSTTVLSPVTR